MENKQLNLSEPENIMGTMDVNPLLIKLSIPMMTSMLVQALYNVVDSIFVARVSENALTAVSLAFSLQNLMFAVGIGTGVGVNALLSKSLGEGDQPRAQRIALQGIFIEVICCAIFILVGIFAMDLFFRGQTADAEIIALGKDYLSICCIFSVGLFAQLIFERLLQATGRTVLSMISQCAGALINIIFDPILIFGVSWLGIPAMGVTGAAIATVLSQLASCVYAVRFLLGQKPPIRITRGGYSAAVMRRVLTLGFSPFIIIALDNVMIIAMNAVLQHYGGAARGDALVTCATIAQSFMLVVTMPLGGITGGTQSILSYNYGAYRTERVRQAQKYIFGLGLVFTAVMTLAARLAGPLFVRLFTTDEALAAQAFDTIKVCTLALLPLGLQYEVVDGFTALGLAKLALPLSLWRKAVYFAAVFALPAFFGADAVFYAEPISDVLGPLASVAVYCVCIRGVLARRAALAPQKLPN